MKLSLEKRRGKAMDSSGFYRKFAALLTNPREFVRTLPKRR